MKSVRIVTGTYRIAGTKSSASLWRYNRKLEQRIDDSDGTPSGRLRAALELDAGFEPGSAEAVLAARRAEQAEYEREVVARLPHHPRHSR